jgi:hypothetical protein
VSTPDRTLRPTPLASAYVLTVAGVATLGFTTDSTAAILLAGLLTLPSSVPAIVAYYVAFGLLAQVPGANPSESSGSSSCTASGECHTTSTGDAASWFMFSTDVLGVLALTAAALLNTVAIHFLLAGRRARRSGVLNSSRHD